MVNLKKISRMAKLSFENALRLHFDTVHLFNNKSFSTAYYLSVLAQEEIGKYYLLDSFAWLSEVGGRCSDKMEEKFLKNIFFHSSKQKQFIFQGGLTDEVSIMGKKFVEEVYSNKLEIRKQNAIYVGLPKTNGKINLKGKINNPANTTEDRAKKQITIINNYFLDFISGILSGHYTCDNEYLEEIINEELFMKIKTNWDYRGIKINRILKEREEFLY